MARKDSESFILEYIGKILPGSENVAMYKKKFDAMSNKEFSAWIDDLRDGNIKLTIQVPPFQKSKLNIRRNIKLAKELGTGLHKRLVYSKSSTEPAHMSPIKYMVLELPVRRTAQSVIKNISTPTDSSVVDMLTGQPTGRSKGAAITFPELQLLPLNNSLVELTKYRGGDNGSYQALINSLTTHGGVSSDLLEDFSTGTTSKNTLKSYLAAAHISNNL